MKFDWGLLHPSCLSLSSPHFLLRPQLAFGHRQWLYYAAMLSNLLLRVTWVFTISPTYFDVPIGADYFRSIVYSLEIVRRQQWNVLRLENEHLTNCEQYRVVNIVPLPIALTADDLHAHTAPEAAKLIRKDSGRELREREQERQQQQLELQSVPSRQPSGSRSASQFRRRLSRDAEDSSPDSSPEPQSPRSAAAAVVSDAASALSSVPSYALLAAANSVALASAGVPELLEAARVAARVRGSVAETSRSSPQRRVAVLGSGREAPLQADVSLLVAADSARQDSSPSSPAQPRVRLSPSSSLLVAGSGSDAEDEAERGSSAQRQQRRPSTSRFASVKMRPNSPKILTGKKELQRQTAAGAGAGRQRVGRGRGQCACLAVRLSAAQHGRLLLAFAA